MLHEQYSGYEHREPNGSGIYIQTSWSRTVPLNAASEYYRHPFYYQPASNGGTVEVCFPLTPSC